MPRCCATILDPAGNVLAYAEVTTNDATTGTATATAMANAMCQTLYPGQPVPPVTTKTVNGKAKGANFPPPSS